MKKNKYVVFIAIGFELIGLIILSLWAGQWIQDKGYAGAQAICVVIGFFIWFASLIMKLKGIK
ncbi:MAG: hypothetical protein WA160_07840 [Pseudobdellovibrio sp.]